MTTRGTHPGPLPLPVVGLNGVGRSMLFVVAALLDATKFFTATTLFIATATSFGGEPQTHLQPKLRRPLALVWDHSRRRLYVGNRCGTVSVIDTKRGRVVREEPIADELTWLAPLGSSTSEYLIAVDGSRHQLALLRKSHDSPGALKVVKRLSVSAYPQFAVSSAQGDRIFVSSLWSRRVTCLERVVEDGAAGEWHVRFQRDLDFAPRVMTLVEPQQRALVADAFGGKLAVMDTASGEVVTTWTIPGHQFRGIVLVPAQDGNSTRVVLAQQMLNSLARSDDNDVHWGLLMSNDLRWLRLSHLLQPGADLFAGAHMSPLGEAGHAAADPSGLTRFADGTVVVTLGGVGEIAYGRAEDYTFRRLRTGRRPTAIVADPSQRRVFVANMFDDSISVIDLQIEETVAIWSLGPQRPLSISEQGELAFYDGRLSMDGWMTCHSCHIDGHTSSQLNDNMSDGSFDSPKRILSLLGKSGTEPLAWNGNAASLEQQIRASIRKTMRASAPVSETTVNALAAYLRTLTAPPGVDTARGTVDRTRVARGKQIFLDRGCVDCHVPPTYTSPQTYDVGIRDEHGHRHFNPPSLRGVSQRDRWLHDGRADSLESVFRAHRHQLEEELSDGELGDLVAFLRQL